MPQRNWLLYPPVGAGLIIALMLAFAGLAAHQRDSQGGNQPAKKELRNIQDVVSAGSASATKPPPAEPNPIRDEWREEKDLVAQQEMADWAWLAMFASWLGAVSTAFGVYFVRETLAATRRTLDEAGRANTIAREIGHAQVRGYLSVSPSYQMGGQPHFVGSVANTGFTPASEIIVSGEIRYVFQDMVVGCERFERITVASSIGANKSSKIDFWCKTNTIDSVPDAIISYPSGAAFIEGVFTTTYKDVFNSTIRQTDKIRWFLNATPIDDTNMDLFLYREEPGETSIKVEPTATEPT